MNNLHSSEISLRAAVISAKKTTTNLQDFSENIKAHALNQLELVEKAEGLMNGIKSSDSFQKATISAAVYGIELAYKAISLSLKEGKSKRRQFANECEKNLATFTIDNNKEIHDFTIEELAIKSFYSMLEKHSPDFVNYCGINLRESEEFPNVQFFSILPFYRMSQALPQHFLINSKLDEFRLSSYHLLQTGLPLEYYYQRFITSSPFALKAGSLWFQANYLNHYRAPRFIVTALANLLWNLQYPVNLNNGIPLSMLECTALAYDAEMLLNDLLNPRQYPYLEQIDSKSRRLNQCLFKIESSIKGLREAFEFENLHEINLRDVSKHMHMALKMMSNKMLELIYQNETAGERLVGQIMMLSTLFIQYPLLYDNFNDIVPSPKPQNLNPIICTIVDVLIIFAHLAPKKRFSLCQELISSSSESEAQLAYQLKEFHKSFLKPFEDLVFENKEFKDKSDLIDYSLTASFFIPLVVLIMESFKVFKDTRPSIKSDAAQEDLEDNEFSSVSFDVPLTPRRNLKKTKDDKAQCESILNDVSAPGDKHKHYNWTISMFLKKKSRKNQQIDELLISQNEIRQNTSELDRIALNILGDPKYLQDQSNRENLLGLLGSISKLFAKINKKSSTIQTQVQANTKLQRDEKRVLQPMLEDVGSIVALVEKAISQVQAAIAIQNFDNVKFTAQGVMRVKSLPRNPSHSNIGMFERTTIACLPSSALATIAEDTESTSMHHKEIPVLVTPNEESLQSKDKLKYYVINSLLGLIEAVLVQNLFTSFFQLSFAINIIACFAVLACAFAFNFYFNKIENNTPEQEFHFQFPLWN